MYNKRKKMGMGEKKPKRKYNKNKGKNLPFGYLPNTYPSIVWKPTVLRYSRAPETLMRIQ